MRTNFCYKQFMQGQEDYHPSLDQYYIQPTETQGHLSDQQSIKHQVLQHFIQPDLLHRSKLAQHKLALKCQQLNKVHIEKQIRLELQTKEKAEREMKECTFQPRVNNQQKRRSKKDFLESQDKFMKKRANKIEQLKSDLETNKENYSFQPQINKYSKLRQPVHERLYAIHKNRETHGQPLSAHQPQINQRSKRMTRQEPVQTILYRDALRRQQTQQVQTASYEAKVSTMSLKLATQRLIKQFNRILSFLGIEKDQDLDYIKFNEILEKLAFLTQNPTHKERALVQSLYEFMLMHQILTPIHICQFALCIKGLYSDQLTLKKQSEEENTLQFTSTSTKFGSFIGKKWHLDKAQLKQLQSHFYLFSKNCLSRPKAEPSQTQEAFHCPQINERSSRLAQQHWEKTLKKRDFLIELNLLRKSDAPQGQITHADMLILQKKMSNLELEFKRKSKESAVLNQSKVHTGEGYDRCHSLYLQSFHRPREDRSSLDIQFEKASDQCTFQPNTYKPKLQQSNTWIANTQNVICRMNKARQLKQINKKFQLRKETKTNSRPLPAESERKPVASFQVFLPRGKSVMINLYEGEDPKEVAARIGRRYSLQEQLVQKLQSSLKESIWQSLQRIEEEANEQTNRSGY